MVKCPYCKNDCPRPILPGWYRCEWCDNHFLTKDPSLYRQVRSLYDGVTTTGEAHARAESLLKQPTFRLTVSMAFPVTSGIQASTRNAMDALSEEQRAMYELMGDAMSEATAPSDDSPLARLFAAKEEDLYAASNDRRIAASIRIAYRHGFFVTIHGLGLHFADSARPIVGKALTESLRETLRLALALPGVSVRPPSMLDLEPPLEIDKEQEAWERYLARARDANTGAGKKTA